MLIANYGLATRTCRQYVRTYTTLTHGYPLQDYQKAFLY